MDLKKILGVAEDPGVINIEDDNAPACEITDMVLLTQKKIFERPKLSDDSEPIVLTEEQRNRKRSPLV